MRRLFRVGFVSLLSVGVLYAFLHLSHSNQDSRRTTDTSDLSKVLDDEYALKRRAIDGDWDATEQLLLAYAFSDTTRKRAEAFLRELLTSKKTDSAKVNLSLGQVLLRQQWTAAMNGESPDKLLLHEAEQRLTAAREQGLRLADVELDIYRDKFGLALGR
jgi:hypothetical protein